MLLCSLWYLFAPSRFLNEPICTIKSPPTTRCSDEITMPPTGAVGETGFGTFMPVLVGFVGCALAVVTALMSSLKPITSILTGAVPVPMTSSFIAAAFERSSTLSATKGPLSFTRTITLF